jgi:hypothetical protein
MNFQGGFVAKKRQPNILYLKMKIICIKINCFSQGEEEGLSQLPGYGLFEK